jgi:hypothetical protein
MERNMDEPGKSLPAGGEGNTGRGEASPALAGADRLLRRAHLWAVIFSFGIFMYLHFALPGILDRHYRELGHFWLYCPTRHEAAAGILALSCASTLYLCLDFLFFHTLKGPAKGAAVILSVAAIILTTEYSMQYAFRLDPTLWSADAATEWRMTAGLASKPNSVGPYTYITSTNSLGFRSGEITPVKPPGEYRVMLIGDSAAFGWGVNDRDTFLSILEKDLRLAFPAGNVRVINAAVHGFVTLQGARLMEDRGWSLSPDLLIIAFNNDPSFDYLVDARKLRPPRLVPLFRLLYRSRIFLAMRYAVKIKDVDRRPGPEEERQRNFDRSLRLYGDCLGKMLDGAATRKTKVIVLSMPHENVLGFSDWPHRNVMRSQAQSRGFLFVNLLEKWGFEKREGLFYDDVHPTPAGNKKIARDLLQAISAEFADFASPSRRRQ